MPTYEYECSKCGHAWELFQSIKAEAERKCPKCAKMTAVRKIGMGAAIFTGARAAEPAGETAAKSAAAAVETTAAASSAETKVSKTDAAKPAGAAADASKGEPGKAAGAATGTEAAKPTAEAAKAPETAAPADGGKVNATHPAREGRGAGNVRDAIQRQRNNFGPPGKNHGKSGPKFGGSSTRRGLR
ncbi:MAG: zinc ribbon domain-containing protein [Planctomycetota bacterium]